MYIRKNLRYRVKIVRTSSTTKPLFDPYNDNNDVNRRVGNVLEQALSTGFIKVALQAHRKQSRI